MVKNTLSTFVGEWELGGHCTHAHTQLTSEDAAVRESLCWHHGSRRDPNAHGKHHGCRARFRVHALHWGHV